MLYCGERIGHSQLMPKIDIAVDPLDGTTLTAQVSLGTETVCAANVCTIAAQLWLVSAFYSWRHIRNAVKLEAHNKCCKMLVIQTEERV